MTQLIPFFLKTAIIIGILVIGILLTTLLERKQREQFEKDQKVGRGDNE